jgi:hypothetical protein
VTRRVVAFAMVMSVVVTGAYLVVYLARWEWQRAIVAGLLLIVAEVALVGGLVLARLARSDTGAQAPHAFGGQVAARLESVPHPPSQAFRWLQPLARGENVGVFLPILLGLGVLASVLGWLAENAARRVTRGHEIACAVSALAVLAPPDRLIPVTDADLLSRPGSWEGFR